jgi:hypothetical protein
MVGRGAAFYDLYETSQINCFALATTTRVDEHLANATPAIWPSVGLEKHRHPTLACAAQYLACLSPCERFTSSLAGCRALLGAGAARYAPTPWWTSTAYLLAVSRRTRIIPLRDWCELCNRGRRRTPTWQDFCEGLLDGSDLIPRRAKAELL